MFPEARGSHSRNGEFEIRPRAPDKRIHDAFHDDVFTFELLRQFLCQYEIGTQDRPDESQ